MINFYTTTASMQSGGIFTLEKGPEKGKEAEYKNGPQSALWTAKENGDKTFYNVESKFTSFFEGLQNAKELGLKYAFGLKILTGRKLTLEQKEAKSDKSSHKIIIFAKNDAGYRDLSKLYSNSETGQSINRIDSDELSKYWTDNLILVIPFYDSYIHNNNLTFGECIPTFPVKNPIYCVENNGLPFDGELKRLVTSSQTNILISQTCYYAKPADFKKFIVYRTMLAGETFNKPNIENLFSDNFFPKNPNSTIL